MAAPPNLLQLEILALRRIAASLLNAYVGRDAGERILSGQIKRGDTENIRCVIWFSDLRGFTALTYRCEPAQLMRRGAAAGRAAEHQRSTHRSRVLSWRRDRVRQFR
jgi:class 3 adenylate cyclase